MIFLALRSEPLTVSIILLRTKHACRQVNERIHQNFYLGGLFQYTICNMSITICTRLEISALVYSCQAHNNSFLCFLTVNVMFLYNKYYINNMCINIYPKNEKNELCLQFSRHITRQHAYLLLFFEKTCKTINQLDYRRVKAALLIHNKYFGISHRHS